eukprot:TRINITY_DN3051_c0_g1_i1.p1 TRINITY_DN3051_c0_g1~~TRINITY_DN3051_c0_g1_i1.p1  ORF type:complete len:2479 (+),score=587.58 TRINITY_DN3051_c0_g1_i1:88-7524(+)
MSYLQQFTMNMTPDKGWDSRFTLGQIPEYNALNDRYCKFWKRGGRKGGRRHQGQIGQANSWSSEMGKMYADNYHSPMMPMHAAMMADGPKMAFQQPAPPNHRIPPPPERVPREPHEQLERLNMTDPNADHMNMFQEDHQHAHTLPVHQVAESVSPAHPSQLLTVHDLKRPHRVTRNTRQLPQNQVHESPDHSMHSRRNQSIQVEKCIEIREGFLYLLQEISERPINGPQEKDAIAKELLQIVSPLRTATLDVIEALQKWAHLSSLPVQDYQWKGVSYITKIHTDLNFFAYSDVASLLSFSVVNNPLLQQLQQDLNSINNIGKDLPPVKQGREPAGLNKSDPLGERTAAAERVLAACAVGTCDDEIEEESYLKNLIQESPRAADGTLEAIPEDDWLARTEDRSKEIEERAAINIQRVYRGFRDKAYSKAKLRQRHAAIVIQKLARKICACKEVQVLSKKRNAARKLQSLQRGIFSRGKVRKLRQEQASAMEIQRVFRGHLGRHEASSRTTERAAAVAIQSGWRGYSTRRDLKNSKTKNRNSAAILIQKHWRGTLIRTDVRFNKQKVEACLRIQRWIRGVFGRQHAQYLSRQRNGCIKLQAWARGNAARNRTNEMKDAQLSQRASNQMEKFDYSATKIQSVWKMHSAKKSVKSELQARRQEAAATAIQARFRGNDTRQSQEQQKIDIAQDNAATKIQSQVRRRQAASRADHIRGINEKAKTIQRVERGRQARKIAAERQHLYNAELERKVAEAIKEEETFKEEHKEECLLFEDGTNIHPESPSVGGSPSAQSPMIIKSSVQDSPKVATPSVQESPKVATPSVQESPKVATPSVQESPKVATPSVQESPKVATPPAEEPSEPSEACEKEESEIPVPDSPCGTLADFVGSVDVTKEDSAENVHLLLAIANEENQNAYGLQILSDVVDKTDDQQSEVNFTKVKTPQLSSMGGSSPRAAIANNDIEAGTIQRCWRKHHANSVRKQKEEIQRCRVLHLERAAVNQERIKAVSILRSFYKIIEARNEIRSRKLKKEARGMGQSKIAIAHEREVASLMIQQWLRPIVATKKIVREKRQVKARQQHALNIKAKEQERCYGAQVIQRGVRLRQARQKAQRRRNTYSSECRAEVLRSVDQERSYSVSLFQEIGIQEVASRTTIIEEQNSDYASIQISLQKVPINLLSDPVDDSGLCSLQSLLQAAQQEDDAAEMLFLSALGQNVGVEISSPREGSNEESTTLAPSPTNQQSDPPLTEEAPVDATPAEPEKEQQETGEIDPPKLTRPTSPELESGVALSYLLQCASDETLALTILQCAVGIESETGSDHESVVMQGEVCRPSSAGMGTVTTSPPEQAPPLSVQDATSPDVTSPEVTSSPADVTSPDATSPDLTSPSVQDVPSPLKEDTADTEVKALEKVEEPPAGEVAVSPGANSPLKEQEVVAGDGQQFPTPSTESIESRSVIVEQERARIASEMEEKFSRELAERERQEAERLTQHESRISELQKQMLEMESKIALLENKKQEEDQQITSSISQSAEADKQHQNDEKRRLSDREAGAAEYQKRVLQEQEERRQAAAITIQSKQRQIAAKKTVAEVKIELAAQAEAALLEEEEEVRQLAAAQIQRGWNIQYPKIKSHRIRAVTKIQSIFRGFVSRRKAIALQQEREKLRQSKAERDALADKSAVEIQRTWRGSQGRSEAKEKHRLKVKEVDEPAAECIQRSWRSKSARNEAARRRTAKDLERERTHQLTRQHNAACTIQRAWRCYNARFEVSWRREAKLKKSKKSNEDVAATKIQSQFRGKQARDTVREKKKARQNVKDEHLKQEQELETVEESVHQQQELNREQYEEEVTRNNAAMVIQRAYRCYNARFMLSWQKETRHARREAERIAEQDSLEARAATDIQCMYRSRVARHELRKRRQQRADSDIVKNAEEERYENAAITIQCAYRVYNSKFEASWRRERKTALQELEQNRKQEEVREYELQLAKSKVQRERELRRTEAALCIQCAWRVYNAKFQSKWMAKRRDEQKAARTRAAEEEKAVQVMQRSARCHLARNEASRRSAAKEQARIDKLENSKREHEKLVNKSATTIQCLVRSTNARKAANKRRLSRDEKLNVLLYDEQRTRAAIKIQCLYRCRTAKFEAEYRRLVEQEEANYDDTVQQADAAKKIQCRYRVHRSKAELESKRREKQAKDEAQAATKIQGQWRVKQSKEELASRSEAQKNKEAQAQAAIKEEERIAATQIQSQWRSKQARDVTDAKRREKLKQEESSIEAEKDRLAQEKSATVIQSNWRGHQVRNKQSEILMEKERQNQLKEENAATKIQAMQRGKKGREEAAHRRRDINEQQSKAYTDEQHAAATKIQALYRGGRDRARVKELRQQRSKDLIRQEQVDHTEIGKSEDAAKLIQRNWRGHMGRKKARTKKSVRVAEALEDTQEDEAFCREEIKEEESGERQDIHDEQSDEVARTMAATKIQVRSPLHTPVTFICFT